MKLIYFILICSISQVYPLTPKELARPKVVNGEVAEEGQFPWLAHVRSLDGWVCTGSLIRENWVLTAAHCVGSSTGYNITLGTVNWKEPSSNGVVITATEDFPNEDYNPITLHNDLALIKLPTNAPISECK